MGRDENLKKAVPFTKENAKEMQKLSAEKRKENNEKKKLLSEMYADLLSEEYKVTKNGESKTISGSDYIKTVVKQIINRGDSSSVSMLKELREATEGNKVQLYGEVTAKVETPEERLEAFHKLLGK